MGSRVSPTRQAWQDMRKRCLNPKCRQYSYYGGRGISICERWLTFDNFLADMGVRPDGMTLDRIDNDGNYEPDNVRWATKTQQQRNTRANRIITHNGKSQCLAAWSEETGIRWDNIRDRLDDGWSVERALTTPGRTRFP